MDDEHFTPGNEHATTTPDPDIRIAGMADELLETVFATARANNPAGDVAALDEVFHDRACYPEVRITKSHSGDGIKIIATIRDPKGDTVAMRVFEAEATIAHPAQAWDTKH